MATRRKLSKAERRKLYDQILDLDREIDERSPGGLPPGYIYVPPEGSPEAKRAAEVARSVGFTGEFREVAPGTKFDAEKPRWELLPLVAVQAVVDVLTYGARKYAPGNWRKVRPLRSRYIGALWRHVVAHCRGESKDPESGLPHLAHAAACVLFLLEAEIGGGRELDPAPRPVRPKELAVKVRAGRRR